MGETLIEIVMWVVVLAALYKLVGIIYTVNPTFGIVALIIFGFGTAASVGYRLLKDI